MRQVASLVSKWIYGPLFMTDIRDDDVHVQLVVLQLLLLEHWPETLTVIAGWQENSYLVKSTSGAVMLVQ